jgi:DNA (cytosine-5)-methyltransferase 1
MAITVCGTGTPKPILDRVGRPIRLAEKRRLMGIDWMGVNDISQAIPPAYTLWLGAQLMSAITAQEKIA